MCTADAKHAGGDSFGVTATCTGQPTEDESWEQELVRDMVAVVASFARRLYGQRSARARRLRVVVAAETGSRQDAA